MIICCEQCDTRFKLDESRIPSGGARVRCSKCEHAFHVQPPEVEAESTLQGVAAEAVQAALPVPEPAAAAPGVTDPKLSEALDPCGDEEVPPEQWTFDDDAPAPPSAEPPLPPTPPPPSAAPKRAVAPAPPAPPSAAPAAPPVAAAVPEPAVEVPPVEPAGSAVEALAVPEPSDADLAAAVDELANSFVDDDDDPLDPDGDSLVASSGPPTDAASLFGAPGDLGESGTFRESLVEEESNEVPEGGPASEASLPPVAEPLGGKLSPSVETSSIEGMGDPKNWDFLADQVPDPRPLDESEQAAEEEAAPTAEAQPAGRAKSLPWFHPGTPVNAASWLAFVLLSLGGIFGLLHASLYSPVTTMPTFASRASVTPVQAHTLENLFGPILVVDGVSAQRLAPGSGLRVQLLDADGEPIEGASAWAGPTLQEERLREEAPDQLRAALVQRAGSVQVQDPFQAIFEDVPAEAYAVAVEPHALPRTSLAEGASESEASDEEGSEAQAGESGGDAPGRQDTSRATSRLLRPLPSQG